MPTPLKPTLLHQAIARMPLARPPVWVMRQAGRYLPEYRELRKQQPNFIDFCLTPELCVEATLQPLRRFAFDASIVFSDILMIPHALGVPVTFTEGYGPKVTKPENAQALLTLREKIGDVTNNLAPVYQTLKTLRHEIKAETSLIGFCGAPWTVACYMLDDKPSADCLNLRKLAYTEPQTFEHLLNTLVEATIAHLTAQATAGADTLMLFDSWAALVPPALFELAVVQPTRRIIEGVRKTHANIPFIVFPRNVSTVHLQTLAQQLPENVALALSHTVDVAWAAQHLQPHIAVQGNLDPALLLSTPAAITAEAQHIARTFGNQPGHIFNLGHGIDRHTPPENVTALIEAIHTA